MSGKALHSDYVRERIFREFSGLLRVVNFYVCSELLKGAFEGQ
jgi:hypothetical protein